MELSHLLSRSTGVYDVNAKIPIYQERGDLEIWRIPPYEHTLTAWRRQPDGTYDEQVFLEGIVCPAALPNVEFDLGDLFDEGGRGIERESQATGDRKHFVTSVSRLPSSVLRPSSIPLLPYPPTPLRRLPRRWRR